jgi:hypothetical protein
VALYFSSSMQKTRPWPLYYHGPVLHVGVSISTYQDSGLSDLPYLRKYQCSGGSNSDLQPNGSRLLSNDVRDCPEYVHSGSTGLLP